MPKTPILTIGYNAFSQTVLSNHSTLKLPLRLWAFWDVMGRAEL